MPTRLGSSEFCEKWSRTSLASGPPPRSGPRTFAHIVRIPCGCAADREPRMLPRRPAVRAGSPRIRRVHCLADARMISFPCSSECKMERRQGGHSFSTTATDGLLFRKEKKIPPLHSYRIASSRRFVVSRFRSTSTITPAWGTREKTLLCDSVVATIRASAVGSIPPGSRRSLCHHQCDRYRYDGRPLTAELHRRDRWQSNLLRREGPLSRSEAGARDRRNRKISNSRSMGHAHPHLFRGLGPGREGSYSAAIHRQRSHWRARHGQRPRLNPRRASRHSLGLSLWSAYDRRWPHARWPKNTIPRFHCNRHAQ